MKDRREEEKQWKLREATVRSNFEENARIRMEGNNSGWEKLRDNIMVAGRETCR